MLFAACATTSPMIARARSPQLTVTSPVSRIAPIASRPPMSPDVTVIENTAARVMTSHLDTASGGLVIPTGRLAVLKTVRQVARRPGVGAVAAASGVAGVEAVIARPREADYMRPNGSTKPVARAAGLMRSWRDGSCRRCLRHAGRARRRRARRADRRRLAAHLPDGHLRPGRRRASPRRLRVLAKPEPDPRAARARGRRPRVGATWDRLRVGLGRDRGGRPARRGGGGGDTPRTPVKR